MLVTRTGIELKFSFSLSLHKLQKARFYALYHLVKSGNTSKFIVSFGNFKGQIKDRVMNTSIKNRHIQ